MLTADVKYENEFYKNVNKKYITKQIRSGFIPPSPPTSPVWLLNRCHQQLRPDPVFVRQLSLFAGTEFEADDPFEEHRGFAWMPSNGGKTEHSRLYSLALEMLIRMKHLAGSFRMDPKIRESPEVIILQPKLRKSAAMHLQAEGVQVPTPRLVQSTTRVEIVWEASKPARASTEINFNSVLEEVICLLLISSYLLLLLTT